MSIAIRVKFIRGGEAKYVSHLELIRVFERAVRRAGLPIAYTLGFNPHPRMVFGLPLAVGVTSEAEYADFELAEEMRPEDFMDRLNRQLPAGLKIVEAFVRRGKSNIMADIKGAAYSVVVCAGDMPESVDIRKLTEVFLARPKIMAEKETKSGVKEIDIKPMIKKMSVDESFSMGDSEIAGACGNGKMFRFDIETSAGSEANLKPELLFA
ncbi:MAG TPA: TIGR03936 family radical SAM-associated protein, partial [Candidatus Avimonas sp.]|nr:TIGR03936 family radical SAM-associated protein [Candidatus Avimonas sp.]